MIMYRNILVAVDLSDESPIVLDKARSIARQYDADLHVVHVIEPIAVGYAIEVSSIDIEGLHQEASRQARESLLQLGGTIDIEESHLHSKLGHPAREIRALAEELSTDLIVIGGHGRHGWELLFGSTSNEVSHGITCDLLTVRIPDKD
jgi:universal stress protein A